LRAPVALGTSAALGVALFSLAFVVAPRSCEGGLTLYFWCGIAALVVWLALPFAARIGRSLRVRVVWSIGLGILGAAVWVAGLVIANVRFICGLGYL